MKLLKQNFIFLLLATLILVLFSAIGGCKNQVEVEDNKTDSGYVKLSTDPAGALVEINHNDIKSFSKVIENTETLKLKTGTYTVTANKENYKPFETEFTVKKDKTTDLNLLLNPETSHVIFSCKPDTAKAKVYKKTDGSIVDSVVTTDALDLPIGEYQAVFSKDGFLDAKRDFQIKEINKTYYVSGDLVRGGFGKVNFFVDPPWGTEVIFYRVVDSVEVYRKPDLLGGSFRIELPVNDYFAVINTSEKGSKTINFTIIENKKIDVYVEF